MPPTDPAYTKATIRRHQLAGTLITIASLLAFAAILWPPAMLLVTAAAGAAYTVDWTPAEPRLKGPRR